MKRILAAALAAGIATSSFADLVATSGKNELRLMDAPCVHGGVLGMLKPEWRPKFKKAAADVNGKMLYACWIDTMDGAYFVLFEDGDGQAYPIQAFIEVPGV
jgi:hypothetical protein